MIGKLEVVDPAMEMKVQEANPWAGAKQKMSEAEMEKYLNDLLAGGMIDTKMADQIRKDMGAGKIAEPIESLSRDKKFLKKVFK